MGSEWVRKIDHYLLRHHPNLWALRLPHLLVPILALSLVSVLIALLTPVEIDDMPRVGTTHVVWLLLAAVPFAYWVVLLMQVRHPVLPEGALRRALAKTGVLLACGAGLVPAMLHVVVLEDRMYSKIEPLAAEIRVYACVSQYADYVGEFHEHPAWYIEHGPPNLVCDSLSYDHVVWSEIGRCVQYVPNVAGSAPRVDQAVAPLLDEFESRCVGGGTHGSYDRRQFGYYWNDNIRSAIKQTVADRTQVTTAKWGDIFVSTPGNRDRAEILDGRYDRQVALSIARQGSADFPYSRRGYQSLLLLLVGYLAYLLMIAGQASRTTLLGALVCVVGLLAATWALLDLDESMVRLPLVVHACVLVFGMFAILGGGKYGKQEFLFELWLCMLPLMGVSVALALDKADPYIDEVMLLEYGVRGCWATLAITPLIHILAERYRSLPT